MDKLQKDSIGENDTDILTESIDKNKTGPWRIVYLPRKVVIDQAKMSPDLEAKISSIDNVGDLIITFNRDIKIPKYYNSFNQTIIEITLQYSKLTK